MALALAAGCDQGQQKDQKPYRSLVTLVESNVDVNRPLAANGVIRLRFDRYLLPSTVIRQSFQLLNKTTNQAASSPIVTYDPVALTVTLSNPAIPVDSQKPWLAKGAYKVVLPSPAENEAGLGLRAIDGAPLTTTRTVDFLVDDRILPESAVFEPTMLFCADVMPVLQAKCGTGSPCHGPPTLGDVPAASLVLTTSDGYRQTVPGRVAQGANTGTRVISAEPGEVFGVDMPLVDPRNPGNSWLLYKVLLAPLPGPPAATDAKNYPLSCATRSGPSRDAEPSRVPATPADDYERSVLSDLVLGREMPYPPVSAGGYESSPLSFEERERLRLWITQGAQLEDCAQQCFPPK
ncbi:MAG: hypothetical protein EXR73_15215 [Myxococcales bacterium]|nr:hypothetical protein [Myxococcales bacterium]